MLRNMKNINVSKEDYSDKLKELTSLALANNEDGWAVIDKKLPGLCNDQTFLLWARSNTTNTESGLRDLAASIFESSNIELDDQGVSNLIVMLSYEDYSGFRAACALAKRFKNKAVSPFIDQIRKKLESFINDSDVSEIAKKYLEIINE